MKLKFRLGLDLGTNSLGWCVYRLDGNNSPTGVVRAGVRIFSDGRNPKDLASLAATRRQARQMRRRHDRVLKRQARFIEGLIRFGLLPVDPPERIALSSFDPYALRSKGVSEPLEIHELGRALYHLAKRRGFKSSRKEKAADEKETGKIKSAIRRTQEKITAANCKTLGQYLAKLHADRKPVRARLGADKEYLLYVQRAMVAEEFDVLWSEQKKHHPAICTDEAYHYLRDTLLFQRRLKPVEPGRCLFEEAEYRIPQCSPLQQRFRILQELNNLRIIQGVEERTLTLGERNKLLEVLLREDKLTFSELRKLLELPRQGCRFNLEHQARRFLKGDEVSSQLGHKSALGEQWWTLKSQQQEALAVLIETADQHDELVNALISLPREIRPSQEILGRDERKRHYLPILESLPFKITDAQAQRVADARLPEGHGNLSRKALEKIVPCLEAEVITYDKAVLKAGYLSHSDIYTGEIFKRLPYYGEILRTYTSPTPGAHDENEKRWGKISNPTVHIGLNQLRVVVNEIIRRWGLPHEVVIELAREFGLSGEHRREIQTKQAANQELNEELNKELKGLGQKENRENRQRLLLWRELGNGDAMDRCCVYTGRRFGQSQLFTQEIEIDHILPFSRTLDDSLSNKVLCFSTANRDKRNQTPYEAFGHSPRGYDWSQILGNAERILPPAKLRRFREDALQTYLERAKLDKGLLDLYGIAETEGFLARHLIDTAYLSRVARRYLTAVCPPNKVWVANGRLTGLLRAKWGLNKLLDPEGGIKNRDDHRHHAVDAAVIGACDRPLIQKLSRAAQTAEQQGASRLFRDLPLPWPSFRDELTQVVGKITVSYKPDHGHEGALHNDTNYGWRGESEKKGQSPLVVRRKPLDSIDIKNVEDAAGKRGRPSPKVVDEPLRIQLQRLLEGKASVEAKHALSDFSTSTGIRRIKVSERLGVYPILGRTTRKPYRWVSTDSNYCSLIYRLPDDRWQDRVITTFEANQKGFDLKREHGPNGEPVILRVHKDDTLLLEEESGPMLMRVVKIEEGKIHLAGNRQANSRELKAEVSCSPKQLHEANARVVGIDPLGYVNDPGFSG